MHERPQHLRTQPPARDAPVVIRPSKSMRSSCMLYAHPSVSVPYHRALSIVRRERVSVPRGLSGTRSTGRFPCMYRMSLWFHDIPA